MDGSLQDFVFWRNSELLTCKGSAFIVDYSQVWVPRHAHDDCTCICAVVVGVIDPCFCCLWISLLAALSALSSSCEEFSERRTARHLTYNAVFSSMLWCLTLQLASTAGRALEIRPPGFHEAKGAGGGKPRTPTSSLLTSPCVTFTVLSTEAGCSRVRFAV